MSRTGIVSGMASAVLMLAGVAAFSEPGRSAATAAGAEPSDSGTVVKIHGVSVTPGAPRRSPLYHLFAMLADYSEFLVNGGIVDEKEAVNTIEGLHRNLTPQTSAMDYVVSLKGNRMRVDMGGSSLLAALTPDGSVAQWAVLDPTSGRLIGSDMFDAAIRGGEAGYNPYGLVQGDLEILPSKVTASGETREIQGFSAGRVDYEYTVKLYPVGRGPEVPVIDVKTSGTAWIADDSVGVEPGVATVLRIWAQNFGNQGNGAALANLGLLLSARETKTVSIAATELIRGSTSFNVTEISRQPLDNERFSGFERQEKPCDCSCDAFKELEALGKLPREKLEAHPKTMALSMCAPRCGMQWAMHCGKRK